MAGILFLIFGVAYFLVCLKLARHIVGKVSKPKIRNAAIAVITPLLFLAPGLDGIWGHYKLNQYCATEAKSEIYGHVPVPESLITSPIRLSNIKDYVSTRVTDTDAGAGLIEIKRVEWTAIRAADKKEVAREVDFSYRGSWYLGLDGGGLGAGRCAPGEGRQSLLARVVRTNANGGGLD